MGRSVHACRVLEARVVRDAELAPVVCIRLYTPYPCPARARVRCSLCRLRVCMCVYDTDAEDISKARTRTIKPQNHDSAALERLVDLQGYAAASAQSLLSYLVEMCASFDDA
jgi:hypothetical protein